MSDNLFTFGDMQLHSDRIKVFLDSQGWYYKDGGANFGYIYRNDAPAIKVQGVPNTFSAQGNSVTIPASAFNENFLLYVADSDASISSATVSGGEKISVANAEITILGKTSGDTVNLQLADNPVQPYVLS